VRRKQMKCILPFFGLISVVLAITANPVHAASSTETTEKWVATFTDQCTNPSICGQAFLGGEWGQGVFVRDNATGATTGEVEVVFAFHDVLGSGSIQAVSHLKTHVTSWSVGTGPNGVPNFVFDDYYSTFTGGTGLFTDGIRAGPPFDSEHCFIGCPLETEIPAVPGHFTIESFFGVDEQPGFSYQANVVKVQ
jgi:hypothetical protein